MSLSSAGMQRVCQHEQIKFQFFVGDKEYECGLFEACFLSPRVSRLLLSDSTADSLHLDIKDDEKCFEQFLKLGSGGSITIDDQNIEVMKSISSSLENIELYAELIELELGGQDLSLENVASRLSAKLTLGLDSTSEISFLASHFYELEFSSLLSLGVCELERVLCDQTLS